MTTRIMQLLKRLSLLFTITLILALLLMGAITVTPTSRVRAANDQWTLACSNNPSSEANYLFGVAAQADDAVVAVGSKRVSGQYQPLIERWAPDQYSSACFQEISTYPSPAPPANSELFGVAQVPVWNALRSFWAVGYQGGATRIWNSTIGDWIIGGGAQPLIERSNDGGKTWTFFSVLGLSSSNAVLKGVAVRNDDDVSAVGYYYDDINAITATLAVHWNGTEWSKVDSANEGSAPAENYLNSVSIADRTRARTEGFSYNNPAPIKPALNRQETWDSSNQVWYGDENKVDPGQYNFLFGVSDLATNITDTPTVTYAVGDYIPSHSSTKRSQALKSQVHTIIGPWQLEDSPDPSQNGDNIFYGMAPIGLTYLWAVGSFQDDTSSKYRTFVARRLGDFDTGSWQTVSSPNMGTNDNKLRAVTVVPGTSTCAGGNNYAVGYYMDSGGVADTLAMVYYITPICTLTP